MIKLWARRDKCEIEVGLESGQCRAKFSNHEAIVSDDLGHAILGMGFADFYSLLAENLPNTGDIVLVIRNGGAGDILLTTPIVRLLHDRGVIVDYATEKHHMQLLENNPNIRSIYDMHRVNPRDYSIVLDFCQVSEYAEAKGFRGHRVEAFGNHVDVKVSPGDFKLDLFLTKDEKDAGRAIVQEVRKSTKCTQVIMFSWEASWEQRNWGAARRYEVLKALSDAGYACIVTHQSRITDFQPYKNVVDFSGQWNLRELATVLQSCSAVVTPDTGTLHMASALNSPTVAYMGPFPPEVRCTHKFLEVLNVQNNCALFPCRTYRCWNRTQESFPMCLDVPASSVVDAVKKVIRTKYDLAHNK